MLYLKNSPRFPRHLFILPLVSSVVIPIIITDIWIEIYHRLCFPLYKMPYIKRSNFIKIDRHKLKYLTFLQKIYCTYCGYANGVIPYWAKIAGETERYWCGIQHKRNSDFVAPKHHESFAEYGNENDSKLKYGIKR